MLSCGFMLHPSLSSQISDCWLRRKGLDLTRKQIQFTNHDHLLPKDATTIFIINLWCILYSVLRSAALAAVQPTPQPSVWWSVFFLSSFPLSSYVGMLKSEGQWWYFQNTIHMAGWTITKGGRPMLSVARSD